MAAIFRGHAPAITPDFRPKPTSKNNSTGKRSVTFGTLKTPQNNTNTTNNNSNTEDMKREAEKNETIRQYAQYRSAPDQFPSYDRLRFVRLPQGWLPEGLRDTTTPPATNNNTSNTEGTEGAAQGNNTTQPQLQHWPCLVYQNLAELVRDLSPDSSKRLKAKFIVEHRKAPQMVVARLLGWDNDSVNLGGSSWKDSRKKSDKKKGAAVDNNNNNKKKMKNRFAEPRIELIKLSGYTLEEYDVGGDRVNDGELLSFVDSQLEFENVCEELIATHVAASNNSKDSSNVDASNVVDVNVARHAYQFRNAVDMALNCLALDVGSDPLPIREESDYVFNSPKLSSGAPSSSTKKKKKEHAGSAKKKEFGTVNSSSVDAATSKEDKKKSAVEKTATEVNKEPVTKKAPNLDKVKAEDKPKSQEQTGSSANGKNEIPPLKHNLDPNESWSDAWKKMRDSGWTWKVGSGLMTDYYYIKPGCKIKGGVKDQDYFESENDAKAYATKNYGWKGEADVKEEKLSGSRTKVKAAAAEEKKPATDKSGRTKTKAAEAKKKAVSSSSTTEKENNSNALVGTKSRPTSGTQAVPLKFQSSKKHGGRLDKIMSASKSKASPMAPVAEEVVVDKKKEETPWKDVWDAMKRSGWGWRGGSGLMTDYYYIKPGCKIKGGTVGQDYFVSVKDVQTYARNIYKWGVVSHEKLMATIEEYAKYSGEVVPPQSEGQEIKVHESWGDAWKKMLKSGWNWKAGSGLMMDYFYIKPGCKIKGSVEGQDYFTSLGDVQKFASRNYGWVGDYEDVGEENVEAAVDNDEVGRGKRRSVVRLGEDEVPKKEKRQKVEKKKEPERALAKEESEDEPSSEEEEESSSDEEDYDDMRSTFSETGFQTKKLFLAECADENVPSLEHNLDPSESWSDAWKKMRDSGWTWKTGSGLMTDYYYIKPGCKTKGGVKGTDYFESVDDVKAFAMRNYGWRGEDAPLVNEANIGRKRSNSTVDRDKKPPAAKEQQLKRQKLEKTLPKTMQDVHKSFKVKSTTTKAAPSEPKPLTHSEKKARWQEMQSDGWRVMKAGRYNALHDWYYIRPNCDLGDANSKLGVDYFLCEDDAIESIKASSTTAPKTAKKTKLSNEMVDDSLQTPADCRTQPQDPAIPLLSSPESDSSTTSSELYEWNNVWDLLQRAGWKVMKAGKYNPLHDWYYVRPNRNPSDSQCVLGRHYFTSQDDVIEFVKSVDEKQSSGKKGKATRKSMGVMLNAFEEAGQEEEADSA